MMIAMLLATAAPAAAPAPLPTPSAEAEALGAELSRLGLLASVLPTLVQKQADEIVAAHPELSDPDKAALRAAVVAAAQTGFDKLYAAIGHGYAQALSVADLRAVVAYERSAPAAHYNAAVLGVMLQSVKAVQGYDLKKESVAAFCARTGKLCPPK